jgi:hypothetical protein
LGTAAAGADVSVDSALEVAYPDTDRRIGGQLSYHVREGRHGMLDSDWRHILDFADATVPAARTAARHEQRA